MPSDGGFSFEQLSSKSETLHAYVHVPFCAVRCGYCDFNTYTATELKGYHPEDFLNHLKAEVAVSRRVLSELPHRELNTIFFGGGTPTLLPAEDLVGAIDVLRSSFGIERDAEITVEANPDSVDARALEQLAKGGVTRVSFGVQSAVPSVLKTLDRTHDPLRVPEVVKIAKGSGLDASIDLIYGAPGESMDDWKRTVDIALDLDVAHISAYALIVEQGTKLAADISAGRLEEPDEDLESEKYRYLDEALESIGLSWYELSNWTSGSATTSKHNLAYWHDRDWWGFGPGAHSHVGSVRWWNVKHPTTYAAKLAAEQSPGAGMEILDSKTRIQEQVMLHLRLRDGLAIDLVKQINDNAPAVVASAIADGWIEPAAALRGRIVLTLDGRLMADALLRRLTA